MFPPTHKRLDPHLAIMAPTRDPIFDKLVFVLLLMFGMPLINTYLLSLQPSVVFWVGTYGRVIVPVVFVCIVVSYSFMHRGFAKRRPAITVLIVLPSCAMMLSAHVHKLIALNASTQLATEDCESFKGKMRLEAAWQTASDLRDACIERKMNITGAPQAEIDLITKFDECPGYAEGLKQWNGEWTYLQALERTEHCAGWCIPSKPLWVLADNDEQPVGVRDRCSLAAAYSLDSVVRRTSTQIVVYCLTLLIVLGVLFGWAGI